MLVITRGVSETLCLGDGIRVTVKKVSGGRVHLAVSASPDVRVQRGEQTGSHGKERQCVIEPHAAGGCPAAGVSVSAA